MNKQNIEKFSSNLFKYIFLIFILSSSIFFLNCPQQMVKMLDAAFPSDTSKKNIQSSRTYINSYLSLQKFDSSYSKLKQDSSVLLKLKSDSSDIIKFEIMNTDAGKYPEKVDLKSLVFDIKGRYITGLAPPHFQGKGNFRNYWLTLTDSCSGHKSEIDSFTVTEIRQNTAEPQALCFVLDHSPSMGKEKAIVLQKSVKNLMKIIKKGDWVSIVKFTSKIRIEIPLTDNPDKYKNALVVDGLSGDYGSGTAIYDAVAESLNELKKAPMGFKKIIILFSDGMDNSSRNTLKKVNELAKSNKTTIFSIAYGLADIDPLNELAEKTGGKFYQTLSSKEFPYVFADIYMILNNYYKISYSPPVCPGKHSVNVSLNMNNNDIPLLNASGFYDKSVFTSEDTVGTVTFMNIEFDFGKSTIKEESMPLIQQVSKAMNEHKSIRIKICGHTDDIGADEYNMNLSKSRADAVAKELVKLGISQKRLAIEGFGKTRPLVPNDSEENRKKNRRTEFVIIEK
jgi:VWFA-related protein